MKKVYLLPFLVSVVCFSYAQIRVDISGAAGAETINFDNTTAEAFVTNLRNTSSLIVNVTGCPVTPVFALTVKGIPISPGTPLDAAGTISQSYSSNTFNGLTSGDVVNLKVTCGNAVKEYNNIFSATLTADIPDVNVFDVIKNNYVTTDPIIVEARNHLINTYDRRHDRAYIVIGPEGEVLSKRPVNLDEDDEFIIYLIAPQNDINSYNIASNGVYSPSDLSQTNPPNPNMGAQSSSDIVWAGKKFSFGPYTNTDAGVTFQLTKSENSKSRIINPSQSLTFAINKFYHVDYAVSVVSTDLSSPDYKVFPIASSTNKTIIAVDEGKRTFISFNVIWYWKSSINKLFKKGFRDDAITRGRDRIKEPYFWDRLNPSFGLSIDDGFRENYFAGGVFEFARGGNISFGGHYGKVTFLADKTFNLGETIFVGTNDDIVKSTSWKWGFYFGITLDTRIFNRLTSALGNNN